MREDKKKHHSCFEWIQLFISISIPVAIAVYTVLQNNRDLAIATANRAQDLDIADNQQQDLIVQECLKTLGKLIEKYGIELNKNSSASLVARFATLSALTRLDRTRRNFLIHLLYEAKLITYRSDNYQPSIALHSSNLTDLNLIDQSHRKVFFHLSLEDTIMTKANFSINVDFYNTQMHYVNATYTHFVKCDLNETKLLNTIFDHAVFINTTFVKAQMQKV